MNNIILNAKYTNPSLNRDRLLAYYIIIFYLKTSCMMLTTRIFEKSEVYINFINLFINIILLILLIITFYSVIRRSLKPFIIFEGFIILIYLFSYLSSNTDNNLLFSYARRTITLVIPIAIYIYAIKSKEMFYDMFFKGMILHNIILIIYVFQSTRERYDMGFSYTLMIPVLLYINEWFKDFQNKYFLLFSFNIALIILYGSRGALLCIIIFFLLKFLLLKLNKIKKIALFSLMFVLSFIFILFYREIGNLILNYLSSIGYENRTITLLFTNLLHDSGRNELYGYYMSLIEKRPILGWGVVGGWIGPGLYPHNIFLELILSFGVIVGLFFCILIATKSITMFFQKNTIYRDLLLIFFSASIPRLMMSHTFLAVPEFWIFIILSFYKSKDCINFMNILKRYYRKVIK